MGRAWSDEDVSRLKGLWVKHGGRFKKIAAIMGRSRGSIDGKSRTLGLQFHGGRATVLDPYHPAAVDAHSVFPTRVVPPERGMLKSGDNQRKLGKRVQKGPWRGMPIFSLSLEERATCPRSCELWHACYANNMGHAKRYRHGPDMERILRDDVGFLAGAHPRGFVVRLHIVGDFYSTSYVEFWGEMLASHPSLRVFGYTAQQPATPIGASVQALGDQYPGRWAIRTSGAPAGFRTLVVPSPKNTPPGAILCPAQTGKTKNCGSCALCWGTERPIAFLRH